MHGQTVSFCNTLTFYLFKNGPTNEKRSDRNCAVNSGVVPMLHLPVMRSVLSSLR